MLLEAYVRTQAFADVPRDVRARRDVEGAMHALAIVSRRQAVRSGADEWVCELDARADHGAVALDRLAPGDPEPVGRELVAAAVRT